MILRVPYYYKTFHCIADHCKDSCCVGWEIDIDEDTYEYYQTIEGAFGKRLRQNMKSGEDSHFILKGKRCPFLNEKNLCDICIHLGEEALCEVCTEYPRFTMEYGNVMEKCMALSCEEVGRLTFESDHTFEYEELVQKESSCYGWDDIIENSPFDEVAAGEEEDLEEEDEFERMKALEAARETAFGILKNRTLPIEERAKCYLGFCDEAQHHLNENNYQKLLELSQNCREQSVDIIKRKDTVHNKKNDSAKKYFLQRMQSFGKLEVLDNEWRTIYKHTVETLSDEKISEEEYTRYQSVFMQFYREREYEYEHLLNYFTFRYFMRAVYDFDLLGKAKLAIVSWLLIRDLDLVRFYDQDQNFTLEDRIDIARIYSKEVEHSDDNIDSLLDMFHFESFFSTEALMEQCN